MRIDSHQHFWKFDPIRDAWIGPGMEVIQKDFLPDDLHHLLAENGIEGCIAVQAAESEEETDFLLSLSKSYPFIRAVVGWVDFNQSNLEQRLAQYREEKNLVGFRKILQSLPPEAMDEPGFLRGLELLQKYGYRYDLLIFPKHLEKAVSLVGKFPDLTFILDHLAKPEIKTGEFDSWSKGVSKLAKYPNVACKVSGMVTEADWKNWSSEDFTPYLDHVVNAFGTDRLLYGSDWPVCILAGNYGEIMGVVENYFKDFSENEQEKVFGLNAVQWYGINQKN